MILELCATLVNNRDVKVEIGTKDVRLPWI